MTDNDVLYVKHIYPTESGKRAQGTMRTSEGIYQTGIYDTATDVERVLDVVEQRDRNRGNR